MKNILLSIVLIMSLGCDSDDGDCDTSIFFVPQLNIQLFSVDTGEDVFETGVYDIEDLMVTSGETGDSFGFDIYTDPDSKETRISFDRYFESQENTSLLISLSATKTIEVQFSVEYVDGECVDSNIFSNVSFENISSFEETEAIYGYRVFVN